MDRVFTFKCGCGDPVDEHVTKVWVDKEDETVCIYSSLDHYLPWYKRVIPAVKYVLGIDNTFVHYKETYMDTRDFIKTIMDIKDFIKTEGETL